jgi:hypothetical protein
MHVILDNYAAHKHPKVIAWLTRHPRVTFHFTPTSACWLNAVEGFFATLTKRRLRRGCFLGIVDLQASINRYLADHNADPKPFRWKADPNTIIAAAARGHQTLDFNPLGGLMAGDRSDSRYKTESTIKHQHVTVHKQGRNEGNRGCSSRAAKTNLPQQGTVSSRRRAARFQRQAPATNGTRGCEIQRHGQKSFTGARK